MKFLMIAGALVSQESVPPTQTLDPTDLPQEAVEEEAPEAEPWEGTFAAGMAEAVRLAASEDAAAALALTDRLLAPDGYQRWRAGLEENSGLAERLVASVDGPLTWLGFERLPARDRAEVRFARGLLHARQEVPEEADREFELARADAGPGALREAAVYALGSIDLGRGEVLRESIPEISGAQPAPPGPSGDEEQPDPLELARACYLAAREHLVERLQLDWRDTDTRANVELCVRRLRELDQIERQREEQREQEPPQDQQPSDQPPEEGGDEQESDQEFEPGEEEQETPDEPMPDEPAESEEQQAPLETSEQERVLTEEQMKQLLEVLRRHQERGDELQQKLRGQRREDVERDW